MKAFWTYTLARIALLALVFALLAGIAFGGNILEYSDLTLLLVALVSLVISSAISFWALAGLRERLALHIQTRAEQMSARIEESRRAEDVD